MTDSVGTEHLPRTQHHTIDDYHPPHLISTFHAYDVPHHDPTSLDVQFHTNYAMYDHDLEDDPHFKSRCAKVRKDEENIDLDNRRRSRINKCVADVTAEENLRAKHMQDAVRNAKEEFLKKEHIQKQREDEVFHARMKHDNKHAIKSSERLKCAGSVSGAETPKGIPAESGAGSKDNPPQRHFTLLGKGMCSGTNMAGVRHCADGALDACKKKCLQADDCFAYEVNPSDDKHRCHWYSSGVKPTGAKVAMKTSVYSDVACYASEVGLEDDSHSHDGDAHATHTQSHKQTHEQTHKQTHKDDGSPLPTHDKASLSEAGTSVTTYAISNGALYSLNEGKSGWKKEPAPPKVSAVALTAEAVWVMTETQKQGLFDKLLNHKKHELHTCKLPCSGEWKLSNNAADVTKISGAGDSLWGIGSNGDLMRISGPDASWVKVKHVSSDISDVAIGGDYVWTLDSHKQVHRCKQPCEGTHWEPTKSSNKFVSLSVNNSDVWAVDSNHKVFKRAADGSGDHWQAVASNSTHSGKSKGLTSVVASPDVVWGINDEQNLFKCQHPCKGGWTPVVGQMTDIAAMPE